MIKQTAILSVLVALSFGVFAQDEDQPEKIKVISRSVEGEIRTLYNDTLYGKIQVRDAQDYYITSITFKEKGKKPVVYSAFDIKRFKQIVPFPDRADFGVEEVYYKSAESPSDPYKKVFLPLDEWK
ncbi:MAG TPA: hypothetical protein DCX54_06015 [Flavobacteriales bacterium]|nr:hypothetical protein [Flavobacteriales bacterium]